MTCTVIDIETVLENLTIENDLITDTSKTTDVIAANEEDEEEGECSEGTEDEEEEEPSSESLSGGLENLFGSLLGKIQGEGSNNIDFDKILKSLLGENAPQVAEGFDAANPEKTFEQFFEKFMGKYSIPNFEFAFKDETVACLYENHPALSSPSENSGIDLFMPEDVEIPANSMKILDLGVTAVLRTCEGKTSAFFLLPRSSISKTPLRMANSVGLIDAGYRDTLKVAVDNISGESFFVKRGARFFQVCDSSLQPLQWVLKKEIEDSEATHRGLGGFGSTGV